MTNLDLPIAISESLYNVLGAVDPDLLLEAACNVIADLELTEEVIERHPVWVDTLDDEGNQIINPYMIPEMPLRHIEWTTQQRWVTPYREIGERETSEEMSARIASKPTD